MIVIILIAITVIISIPFLDADAAKITLLAPFRTLSRVSILVTSAVSLEAAITLAPER